MLGAPLVTFMALKDIQIKALELIEAEQQKRDVYNRLKDGVERRWEPPVRSDKAIEELERNNPFN